MTWDEGVDLTDLELRQLAAGVVGEELTEQGVEHVLDAAQTAKRLHHLFGEVLAGQMVVEIVTTPAGFFFQFLSMKNRRMQ